MKFKKRAILLLTGVARMAIAQTGPIVTGAGYNLPPAVGPLAPGQIAIIYVSAGAATFFESDASGFPLPTTLAGVSVSLRQFTNSDPISVPILSVRGIRDACPYPVFVNPDPCFRLAIAIQVPYGLSYNINEPPPNNVLNELVVSYEGIPGPHVGFTPAATNLHVVTSCDLLQQHNTDCDPRITHANGSLVQATNPAQPGEEIVLYAFGMGETNPRVTAGIAAPSPPATTLGVPYLTYDFTPNGQPPVPGFLTGTPRDNLDQAVFAGLVPGFSGLYQVNFRAPTPPPGTLPCLASVPASGLVVQSNVAVTLSFGTNDGARFCVAVPPPSQPQLKPANR